MKEKGILFTITLLLIGGAGWALTSIKQNQKWSSPGVKVSVGPLLVAQRESVTTNTVELPIRVSGYESQASPMASAEVDGLPADTTFGRRRYWASDGFETMLTVVLMGADRTSLHPPRYCIEGQGCSIQKIEQVAIPIEEPVRYDLPVSKVTINKQLESNGQKYLVSGIYLYWYVSETAVRAEYSARLWSMLNSLLHGQKLDRWSYVSCFSLCRPGEEAQTLQRMEQFLSHSVPQFQLVSGTERTAALSVAPR